MRSRVCSWLVVLLLVGGSAHADWDAEATARGLYQRGMAHFQLEEYEVAIQLWQQAYRLKPAPELLFNIAQAYRFSSERALSFYKKFLLIHPNAPNRPEVERQIALLTRALAEQQAPVQPSSPSKIVTTPQKTPATTTVSAPTTSAAPAKSAPDPAHVNALLVSAKPEKSVAKRGWFWAGMVVLAAAVAVGVGVGVTYGTKPSDPNPSFGIARGN